jgi:hypothetical protein
MLKNAIEFLTEELNQYLQKRDPVNFQQVKPAVMSNLMKPDGSFAVESVNGQGNEKFSIAVTLINLEEDRVAESQWFYRREGDKQQVVEPPLNLNLYILFSAVADKYATALTLLHHVLGFFHANPVFDQTSHPHLNAKANPDEPWFFVHRMVANLYTLSIEQQNNLWAALGAKYMPSAIYKIRTLTYTDVSPRMEAPAITEININNS